MGAVYESRGIVRGRVLNEYWMLRPPRRLLLREKIRGGLTLGQVGLWDEGPLK